MKHNPAHPPTIEQCSDLLDRICSSNELKRSGRLKDFLHYVGKRALEGENVQISESDIGVHVFERHQDYDTSADNIVRVNASELRKRILAYYAAEGVDETIVIEIPRGSYSPVFTVRTHQSSINVGNHEPTADGDARNPSPAMERQAFWHRMRHNAVLGLALGLAIACSFLFYQNRNLRTRFFAWKSEPTLAPFWSGFLESPRETDIVVADTSVAVVEFILKQHISLNDYLNHSYTEQIQSSSLSPELKSDLEDVAARNNGSIGDFRIAEKIADLDPNSGRIHLQYARDYRPRTANGHNLVLIGSSTSNPWSALFEEQLNFVIEYDNSSNQMLVRNRHPQPGESTVYAASGDPGRSSDFSVIDYIPNQDHSGKVLILAGTDSEATEAAGNFITTEASLRSLRDRLKVESLPYFELLLKTTRLGGAPLTAEIVTYRTFPDHYPDAH